jgi:hypothetical protein
MVGTRALERAFREVSAPIEMGPSIISKHELGWEQPDIVGGEEEKEEKEV